VWEHRARGRHAAITSQVMAPVQRVRSTMSGMQPQKNTDAKGPNGAASIDRRSTTTTLGQLLRHWRSSRGMSQLDLALRAGFSARHLSFIETGRTQPSRQALLVLAETLDVPLRERNRLLEAGGYAHVYPQTPLAADEMRHIRGVLQFILDRHEPYGALVLDRYSNLLMGNSAAMRLVGAIVDPSLLGGTPNLLRMVFHPLGLSRAIVNWDDVARHLLVRAEGELDQLKDDPDAAALLAEIRGYAGASTHQRPTSLLRAADLLLPVHIRKDDLQLRFFSTIMTLGTPQDVTLQEIRIETFFPADAESEERLRAMS
jgi:transcriptional regulator with XRE-family HTH domain